MVITDFAIRRPLVTVVAMLALVVGGLFALTRLPTDEFPDVQFPQVTVLVPYPGAAPAEVEREVLKPVEQAIRGVSGVRHITGVALDGYATLSVEFTFGTAPALAAQDVRDAITTVRQDLPQQIEEPLVQRISEGDAPIVSLVVAARPGAAGAGVDAAALSRVADPTIVQALRAIPGVAQARVVGGLIPEMTVELRPEALTAAGVGLSDVLNAVSAENLAAPVGRLQGPESERTLRFRGRLAGADEFAALPVAARGGGVVRLGDVAAVRAGREEVRTAAFYNGRPAVSIDVRKARGGYSTTDVAGRVLARVAELQRALPAGAVIEVVRNSGDRVDEAVGDVQKTLLEGAVLTVLVVFVFLNSWRSTVITGLALPISVLAAFIAVWALGFKLETMSLLGLSLAIGILIDDAIVVRENIVRHVEMGKDHVTASHEGTSEIGLAVTATTLAIVAVFVPVAFMSGLAGQYFKPFALTIAASVLVSLFVSFSLDPMLSAYWPDPHVAEHERPWVTRQLDRFNRWFDRLGHGYKGVIAWALGHRAGMAAIVVGSLVAALAMPAVGIVGVNFIPADDRSEAAFALEAPPGADLAYTARKAEQAAAIARAYPEVTSSYTTVGDPVTGAVTRATVYLKLRPRRERTRDAAAVAAALRRDLATVGGATVSVSATGDASAEVKPLQLQVRGTDLAAVTDAAARVAAAMRAVPGAVDVTLSARGDQPVVDVAMQRVLAGRLGVTAAQVAEALRVAYAGVAAGRWVDPDGQTRDVRVRLAPEARARVGTLETLPLVLSPLLGGLADPAAGPRTLPLGQVADVAPATGPAEINHLDGDPSVTVRANVAGRPLGHVSADVDARVAALRLPDGVRVTQGGDVDAQGEVFGAMAATLVVAVVLMYFILVLQFGSFLEPIPILISLPLSLIGVMGALALTGETINMMSLIGVVLLMGIVAKNAILLVDFAKLTHETEGVPMRQALIDAGAVRLRPIVMTTVALVAGMLPVAFGTGEGAQFRSPLGVSVIGGTITSTVLTLLVIPTIYDTVVDWRARAGRAWRRGRGGASAAASAAPPAVPPAVPEMGR